MGSILATPDELVGDYDTAVEVVKKGAFLVLFLVPTFLIEVGTAIAIVGYSVRY